MRMLEEDDDNDRSVTWADQQSINRFSRLNSRLSDVQFNLKKLSDEQEGLGDIALELELVDEEEVVQYKMGDAFVSVSQSRALELLERDQEECASEMERLEKTVEEYEAEMKKLKVVLYAKFGSNINLERD